jgi:formylglycine-generating enzyme required for sulfatase activity
VQRAGLLGADPRLLVRRLEVEKADSARRALILALGEYSARDLPASVRKPLTEKLLAWYRDDPDAGVHGAIDWLLRHDKEGMEKRPLSWGQSKALKKVDEELKWRDPDGNRRWYVNGQGQTMVLVKGPVQFRMGSPHTDPRRYSSERPALRCITRNFAIASKAVTIQQWQRFLKERPDVPHDYRKRSSTDPGEPIGRVSWYAAAAYCNWLNEKEGIPKKQWCYPEKIGVGMKLLPGYLKKTGYRLPTEAEWEFACRAGAVTIRNYGSSRELLPRHAWFPGNANERTWPVGQKRPNDLGLFDMHGNVWTWCQDRYLDYPRTGTDAASEDQEDSVAISNSFNRVLRGGSFVNRYPSMRAADRGESQPDKRYSTFGFRLARTCP